MLSVSAFSTLLFASAGAAVPCRIDLSAAGLFAAQIRADGAADVFFLCHHTIIY
ncbi:MAG: hypothetical protein LBF90_02205 [Prevotellaceae bacterium]|jgi:hypothetical protein|nr:hypothetical protein [Prevotellaceae bacterium]